MAILRLHLATMPHLRTQSPLSRSAGEGPGVRAPPHTFPQPPFDPALRERSNGDPAPASCNDAAFTNPIPPLPQRGRGARGEGNPGFSILCDR